MGRFRVLRRLSPGAKVVHAPSAEVSDIDCRTPNVSVSSFSPGAGLWSSSRTLSGVGRNGPGSSLEGERSDLFEAEETEVLRCISRGTLDALLLAFEAEPPDGVTASEPPSEECLPAPSPTASSGNIRPALPGARPVPIFKLRCRELPVDGTSAGVWVACVRVVPIFITLWRRDWPVDGTSGGQIGRAHV